MNNDNLIQRLRIVLLGGVLVSLWLVLSGCTMPFSQKDIEATPQFYSPPPSVESTQKDPRIPAIDDALREAVAGREDLLVFLIYDVVIHHVDFSSDGNVAVVYLAQIDRDTGEVIPAEPGVAIAQRVAADSWQITLQADVEFVTVMEAVPEELLDQEMRQRYLPGVQKMPHAPRTYSGYLLPWKGGESRRVSGSIGHVFTYKTCPTTCLYAFDFSDGTMFPVHAAKGGTVKYAVWRFPNNQMKNANFLVLEDTTTQPTTYQIYYHLAQNSIPPELRVPGTRVLQGQFIGIADNTGPSTGHHLHFHVHATPNNFWGTSVDITFDDVQINGGRPRTCSEARSFPKYGSQCVTGNWLVSGNGDAERPTGGITHPVPETVITQSTLNVSGWGRDDRAVQSMQLLITNDGNWKPIGPVHATSPFTATVDLCTAEIPDGQFFLSLQVMDTAGKMSEPLTGLTALEKRFDCFQPTPVPPPACLPSSDQVALYSNVNYLGTCSLLKHGEYPNRSSFGAVGSQAIQSILIGSETAVELYSIENYSGSRSVILESQPNLKSDPVGAQGVTSMVVQKRPPLPEAPALKPPVNAYNRIPSERDAITLQWEAAAAAVDYRSELIGEGGFKAMRDWSAAMSWEVGNLPVGKYHWTVWARNIAGESQASLDFEVLLYEQPPDSQIEPLDEVTRSTAVLLKWTIENNSQADSFEIQYRIAGGEWKDWGAYIPGNQRRVWFFGNPGDHYQFRMRAVKAGGSAQSYPELAETETIIEMECTPDEYDRTVLNNDDPSNPTPLDTGVPQTHNFCGMGDQDWFIVMGEMGKSYRFRSESAGGGAAAIIELYDRDSVTLLGQQKPVDLGVSAELTWIAPDDGLYFLRLRPLDARLAGSDARYTLSVDPIGQVYTPPLLCSALLLPLIWLLIKLFLALRARLYRE